MHSRLTQIALGAGVNLFTLGAWAQAAPPGPPVYDPNRPLPTVLPPDPPYADPNAEEEAPGAPAAAPPAASSPPPTYATAPNDQPPAPTYAAAPPPDYAAPPPSSGSRLHLKMPDFSAQLELLNVLPYGRLGLDLEVGLLDWLTIQSNLTFVTNDEPWFVPDSVRQKSDGLGALAGFSVSAGIWPGQKAFEGFFVRAGFTNYAYRYEGLALEDYESNDVFVGQRLDAATHVDRRLAVLVGESYRWKWLIVTAGAGIEYELNQQRRCLEGQGPSGGRPFGPTRSNCESGEFTIQRKVSAPNGFNVYDMSAPLYPFNLVARVAVGIVIAD